MPVILLLALGIAAAIGSRALRLSPVMGYLALGIALSGMGPDRVVDNNSVGSDAQLGVVFLLFDVGLHFSFRRLREQTGDIFGFGPVTRGTLLGGMVLAEAPYRAIVQSEIKPLRGLLLGFFFFSVGMSPDRQTRVHAWPAVLLATVLLITAKMVLNLSASLVFRWSIPGSMQLGFLLTQGSEFAFVIFSLRSVRAMVGEQATAVLVAAVALSLTTTPGIAELGRSLAGRMRRHTARSGADPELVPREMPGPVFIAGMGRRGRAVADAPVEFGIGYAAVEREQRRLREAAADGYVVAYGDVGNPRLWSAVAMQGRRISVLTAPSLEVAAQLTPMARTFFPNLKRLAAVADAGASFSAAGVQPVIDDDPVPGVEQARIEAWAARQWQRAAGQPPEALAVVA